MRNIQLNILGISDQFAAENFQKIQDFLNGMQNTQNQLQACEVFVTGNVTSAKLSHKLGGVPLDVLVTRLIAPSAARLKFRFADFTKTEVIFDVTGLSAGETLSARFLVGTFPDVVAVGEILRASTETQEYRSKF
jgi:hypothetical protein